MSRRLKIGLALGALAIVLPIVGIVVLFVGVAQVGSWPAVGREILLPNHGTLIIEGKATSRSEHGFSQRAGYRPPGSADTEWFGDVCDGVEPQFYEAGPLIVVIDAPSARLYIRTREHDWKSLALVFPNDLGPFPISFYADKNGLTAKEVARINELGGKRERKWPTTYIESFDPETRDLKCSYHVDNASSWPLHLQLSADGTHLALVAIGEVSP